ncbi:bi-domain-containing oxidoreductase [Rhizobium helianthi]|uniref:Bi-domain-containing oxidoreductase n=1 Tax=Rhizobium helianthi TaxID=1132695 RepID=A0ABW4M7E2_9HYPH
MLVDFGRASLLQKALKQPERVKMVVDKARTDGVMTTIDAVRSKLGEPLPLGYCHVGKVVDAGSGCENFAIGDRVASNGPHADIVSVPKNLCARIPDEVSDEAAAFTVVASIGLQGMRLAAPTLGEAFVVTGAGLIGLLTVQLLLAQGCRVLAIDFDDAKLRLAAEFGAQTCNPGKGEDPVAAGMAFSRGAGVDGVIITASTASSDPVTQAARMSRKRGRIILVGVTGLELNRADFYEKELSFQVSCSYGPGRYDPQYEQKGQDYPLGFVRWTEQRNFEAVLDMMASGRLRVEPLISSRIPFDDAPQAYDLLTSDKSALGVLLLYAHPQLPELQRRTIPLDTAKQIFEPGTPTVGFLGAGNYASRVLIPAFRKAGAQLHSIVTAGGTSGAIQARKAGFANASTDSSVIFGSAEINTVAIATRHDTHARLVIETLEAGKNVFVEKPLALTAAEVDAVEAAYTEANQVDSTPVRLMVGFNRRFAPHVQKMKALLSTVNEPKSFIMTMNAGAIPPNHWTQDIAIGGGRIIGEACHYVDLMRFLAGSPIVSVSARRMGNSPGVEITEDKAVLTLGFADGSFGTINYFANGAKDFPKERIEAFCAGRVLHLDNFRSLQGYGWSGFRKMSSWSQDKGQDACAAAFLAAITKGEPSPIAATEIFEVARATIAAAMQLREQK